MKRYLELLRAAREVVWFKGPTEANLARLRDAVMAVDEMYRAEGIDEDDEDEPVATGVTITIEEEHI